MSVTTLHTFDTVLEADSAEWCPHFDNILACGTYHLQTSDKKKIGILWVLSIKEHVEVLLSKNMLGIFDLKWCQKLIDRKIILAISTSEGYIHIILFRTNEFDDSIKRLNEIEESCFCVSEGNSLLFICWINNTDSLLVSDSKGIIWLLQLHFDLSVSIIRKWEAHNYECWAVECDNMINSLFYSVGDDCTVLAFDFCSSNNSPVSICEKRNQGTTCLSSAKQKFLLVTGSFDEELHIFDSRIFKTPLVIYNVNSGIWRIKWSPNCADWLLVAAIYNGFHIINLKSDNVLQSECLYNEHNSLAYGSDWFVRSSQDYIIASCSFYDHKLAVWEWHQY